MIQTINQSQFIDAFRAMGRETQFSYAALVALFEWLEEIGEHQDYYQELDVIQLCCEFTEYSDLEEYNADYNTGDQEDADTMEDIENKTIVIPIGKTESFIIQNF